MIKREGRSAFFTRRAEEKEEKRKKGNHSPLSCFPYIKKALAAFRETASTRRRESAKSGHGSGKGGKEGRRVARQAGAAAVAMGQLTASKEKERREGKGIRLDHTVPGSLPGHDKGEEKGTPRATLPSGSPIRPLGG